MLKLCWVTEVKLFFLVLVYVFNFNLFEFEPQHIHFDANLNLCTPNIIMQNNVCAIERSSNPVAKRSSFINPNLRNFLSVNTKVDLRFHVASAEWISEDVRHKILERVR